MEVFLTGRGPHALAGPQAHGLPVAGTDQADAVGAHQQLSVGVTMPIGAGAWGEPDESDDQLGRAVAGKDRFIQTSPVKSAAGVLTAVVVLFLFMFP